MHNTPEAQPSSKIADGRQKIGEYSVPYGYEVWKDGVYKKEARGGPDGETAPASEPDIKKLPSAVDKKSLKRITHRPVWISGLGRDTESGGLLVRLSYESLGRIKEGAWVEHDQIANRRKLVDLNAFGVCVDSENAGEVLVYLRKAIAANNGRAALAQVATRSGPHQIDGYWGYLLGQRWIGPPGVQADPLSVGKHWTEAFKCSGDWDAWRAKWLEIRQSPFGRWFVAASFAAPLLRWIGRRSFFIHVYGKTTAGKTAITKFATSVWGDPLALMVTFNATQIAMTEMFKHFTDVPVLIDERQAVSKKKFDMGEFIYAVAMGKGRARATKVGGVRGDVPEWKTIIYTTGEQGLISEDDVGGQANRVLQVYVGENKICAGPSGLHTFCEAHHGHAGYRFIEHLQSVVNIADCVQQLKDYHAEAVECLLADGCWPKDSEHVQNVAVVVVAQTLSDSWLLGADARRAFNQALDDARFILKTIFAHQAPQDLDLAERALEFLRGHRTAHHYMYLDIVKDEEVRACEQLGNELKLREVLRDRLSRIKGLVGVEVDEGIWLLPSEINRILIENGFAPDRIWRDFAMRGWLVQEDGRTQARRVIGDRRHRMFVIKRHAFEGRLTVLPGGADTTSITPVQVIPPHLEIVSEPPDAP